MTKPSRAKAGEILATLFLVALLVWGVAMVLDAQSSAFRMHR